MEKQLKGNQYHNKKELGTTPIREIRDLTYKGN